MKVQEANVIAAKSVKEMETNDDKKLNKIPVSFALSKNFHFHFQFNSKLSCLVKCRN